MSGSGLFESFAVLGPDEASATAARDILLEGGTAAEAALAAAAVAAITQPDRNGLGGDGLWLLRGAGARGRVHALDARGPAVAAARPSRFRSLQEDDAGIAAQGPESVLTTPGAVGGWSALEDFAAATGGRMSRRRLLEPALQAARRDAEAALARAQAQIRSAAEQAPPAETSPDARGPRSKAGSARSGDTLGPARAAEARAALLDYLIHAGLQDFYRGDVAREIAADAAACGVLLKRQDLSLTAPRWRAPVFFERGAAVRIDGPPTRRATTVLTALALLAEARRGGLDQPSAFLDTLTGLGLAARLVARIAAANRPLQEALGGRRVSRVAALIEAAARPVAGPVPEPEAAIAIAIRGPQGDAAVLVQSLGTAGGAGVVLPRTGIALGNRGSRFALDPASGVPVRPGRVPPISSLPFLMRLPGGREAALAVLGPGTEGGLQILARLLAGAGAAEAMAAPRFGWRAAEETVSPLLCLEASAGDGLRAGLRRAGLETGLLADAGEALLLRGTERGRIEAEADPRGGSVVIGL